MSVASTKCHIYAIYFSDSKERKAVQMLRLDRQHKRNSLKSGHYSYRKHSDICAGGDMVMCEWGRCRVAPMTTRELTTHINEHIFLERCA